MSYGLPNPITGYIEMVEAAHYGSTNGHDGFVLVKFSDLSTASMTVVQFDAIMDHCAEVARADR